MGLAVARVDRPPVPNADRRPPLRGHERPLGIAAYAPTIAIGTTGIFMSSASRDVPWRNRWSHPSVDASPRGTR